MVPIRRADSVSLLRENCMTNAPDKSLVDRPPGWAAWGVSLGVHLGMLVILVVALRPPAEAGPAQEPVREVGIVLKTESDEGPVFEDESSEALDDAELAMNDALHSALPSATEIQRSAAALPRSPSLAAGAAREDASDASSDETDNASDNATTVADMSAGGAPSKRLGRSATTSVFGASGTGTRFVYVFDRSISMAGAPLHAAKEQLIASLAPLDSVHQFQVIFFNHEPQSWDLTGGQNRIAFATDANKRSAEKFIRSVVATGGTFRRSALQLGLRLRPDVIFFLTDTDDPMSARDMAAAIARARRAGTAINTIEYGSGRARTGENFLVELAEKTGGQYVYVDTGGLGR